MARIFQCPYCDVKFSRSNNRARHIRNAHTAPDIIYDCPLCGVIYHNIPDLHNHINTHAANTDYEIVDNLFNDTAVTYRKRYLPPKPSLELTLGQDFDSLIRILASEAARKRFAKGDIVAAVEFIKIHHETGEIDKCLCLHMRSRQFILTLYQNYANHIQRAYSKIKGDIDDFLQNGSGWLLHAVYRTDVKISKVRPLAGSCGEGELGDAYYVRESCSIPNQILKFDDEGDNNCFFYAVACHFLLIEDEDKAHAKAKVKAVRHGEIYNPLMTITKKTIQSRAVLRRYVLEHFNIEGISVPTTIRDIAKFERLNNQSREENDRFKINVLYREESEIYPVYASKQEAWKHNINLLLYKTQITQPDGNVQAISHYAYIDNDKLGNFLRKTYLTVNPGLYNYSKLYICPNCLSHFYVKQAKDEHFKRCCENRTQAIRLPKNGESIYFRNHFKRFKVPLIGFYDFESVMVKPEAPCLACNNMTMCYHKTEVESIQQAGTYSIIILNHLGSIVFTATYSGDDCADKFVECLLQLEPYLQQYLDLKKPMDLTGKQQRMFASAQSCHICGEPFAPTVIKVRDHCHLTGEYMGAAHQLCNLQRVVVKKIPLFCHNFTGYDSHIVVQGLKRDPRILTIKALARNTEKFRTIQLNSYHLLDSMSFLNGSLADLVDDLRNSGHKFELLEQTELCLGRTSDHKSLLLQKGIYPYEFATSVQQLRDAKSLPSIEQFYSKVSNSGVSDEDYRHAEEVYRQFSCQNMLEYCELYCRLDTVLLAECFLSFRSEVQSEFDLDCCHYISLPQLAFDGMLKTTGVFIEPLTDIDMILFLESNIRGGVSFINQRQCIDTYDKVLEETGSQETAKAASSSEDADKMLYIDANNLYGYAQSCPMPIGDYRWMTDEEKATMDWRVFDDDESRPGYILEVDLDYPEELHLLHNSLPLAPHRMNINESIISPYSLECLKQIQQRDTHSSSKLVSSFLPRRNYVVHAANLALYLSLGMKLVAVHKVLTFTQSTFLKSYIDFCTSKRAASKSEFRKRLFKDFSNSNFGKFIEQTRNHLDCHIVQDKTAFQKWSSLPRFQTYKRLCKDADIVAMFLDKPSIHMKQAWTIGFTILERSKELIYNHFYNIIKPALGGQCSVIFTDTDSLCLRIKSGKSVAELTHTLRDIMDFSNYPLNHPQYDGSRKNQLKYWKDEMKGQHLSEFVGLASKTYSMRVSPNRNDNNVETKSKCKGVGRGYRKSIPFADYKKCVWGIDHHRVMQYRIQSKNHIIQTLKMDRLCFSSFDDKRYIMPCGIHSVAYGSRFIDWSKRYNVCMFCKY